MQSILDSIVRVLLFEKKSNGGGRSISNEDKCRREENLKRIETLEAEIDEYVMSASSVKIAN